MTLYGQNASCYAVLCQISVTRPVGCAFVHHGLTQLQQRDARRIITWAVGFNPRWTQIHIDVINCRTWPKRKPETGSSFATLWSPSWISLRPHNSAADGPIRMKVGTPTQNYMPMTKETWKWNRK